MILRWALLLSAGLHFLVLITCRVPVPYVEESVVQTKKLQVLHRRQVPPQSAVPTRLNIAAKPQSRALAMLPTPLASSVFSHTADSSVPASATVSPSMGAVMGSSNPSKKQAEVVPVERAIEKSVMRDNFGEAHKEALREYRIALAGRAKRFRLYPQQAQEMGLGGRTEVEVTLTPMFPPELRLFKTSGYEELDKAALEMLRRAVSAVPVPSPLADLRHSFMLPVEFVPQP